MYALPVIRYLAGIVSWSQVEIDATDVKTKKNPHQGTEGCTTSPAPWAMKWRRARISECQSQYLEWNKVHPWLTQEDGPTGWTAKRVPLATEGWWRGRENIMEDQAPPWNVSIADRGSGWHQAGPWLIEQLEQMWKVKSKVNPALIGALWGCEPQTRRVAERFQVWGLWVQY